jgi:multiple sugar transport system permease protein
MFNVFSADKNLRFVLIVPAVVLLLLLTVFPIIYILYFSFFEYSSNVDVPHQFVGLENFKRLLTDEAFHNALKNTIFFTVVAVSIEFALGLGFALLVMNFIEKVSIIKTILLIPMMIAPIAVAITWKFLYAPFVSPFNHLRMKLGQAPILFTSDVKLAMPSIIFVDIWQWTPFIFLMMLAGLASLPKEPYEAAQIDGASSWQQFRDLTWKFLQPVIIITLLLRIMDAFRLFDQVFILTRGGPASVTDTLSFHIYKVAFRFWDIGWAAAMSLFMLAVTLTISIWFVGKLNVEK